VPDAQFRTITVDYPIEFARVLRGNSPNAVFSFLSGSGADPTGRSRMAFARYKGEAKKALIAAGFPHVCIFRPAYIYPGRTAQRTKFQLPTVAGDLSGVSGAVSNQVIPVDDLAHAMVDVTVRETGEQRNLIFENRDIRKMVD
jgi:uncharacterized protein YbjT (DUF2867 family)